MGFLRPAVLVLGLLLATLPDDALTAAPETPTLPFGRKHLVFAQSYRAANGNAAAGDYAVLGHYDFKPDHTARLSYFFYDARLNQRPNATSRLHPRLTAGSTARPGPIQIPAYARAEHVNGTWSVDDGVLRVRVGAAVHAWSRPEPARELFTPRGPYVNAEDGTPTINGWTYSEPRGYAYLTDYLDLPRKLTRADLLPDYKGEIQSLVPQRGGPSHWMQKGSDLHVQRYQVSADGDVLGFVTSSRWVSAPTLVFSTLLLNYAPYSKLLVYSAGGHDFNHNGVFDEYGHSLQLFGIYDGSKVERFVYVEYSYQDAGYPILSVGHYYEPAPPAPAPTK